MSVRGFSVWTSAGSPAKHVKQFSLLLFSILARRPTSPSHCYRFAISSPAEDDTIKKSRNWRVKLGQRAVCLLFLFSSQWDSDFWSQRDGMTGGKSPVLYMSICSQQELPEQSVSSPVCVHGQNRQQLGRLTIPLHYNPSILCILGTFHANVILTAETWIDSLNESTFPLDWEWITLHLLLGWKILIWPQLGWNHPLLILLCYFGSVCTSDISAFIFTASLWFFMRSPSINKEQQCNAGMMLLSKGILAGIELLASLHNFHRHTLNLHFNEIFSCH